MSAESVQITLPTALLAALECFVDARLALHGIIAPPDEDTITIDAEQYLIRRSVGHPTVLVQIATGLEVELPAPMPI